MRVEPGDRPGDGGPRVADDPRKRLDDRLEILHGLHQSVTRAGKLLGESIRHAANLLLKVGEFGRQCAGEQLRGFLHQGLLSFGCRVGHRVPNFDSQVLDGLLHLVPMATARPLSKSSVPREERSSSDMASSGT